MSKPFTRHDYAVMRHGEELRGEIIPESREICAHVADGLVAYINSRGEGRFLHGVSIFHSPQIRARLTAEIIRDELADHGVVVSCFEPIAWLDCDEYLISEERIAVAMSSCGGSLGLFISHRPDIEKFIGSGYGEITNCSLYSAELTIRGH